MPALPPIPGSDEIDYVNEADIKDDEIDAEDNLKVDHLDYGIDFDGY